MRLYHNIAAMNVFDESVKILNKQNASVNKISSGYKINGAKDGPNALVKSEGMRMQIRGLQMANRNSQEGMSMLQTFEGGLSSTTDMLQRIRELTVQAGGVNTDSDRQMIQGEIKQLLKGIDYNAENTQFNGKTLLNAGAPAGQLYYDNNNPTEKISVPTGANVGETVDIPKFNLQTFNLQDASGNKLSDIDVTDPANIDKTLGIIDSAVDTVSHVRSKYGALENTFQDNVNNLNEISDKIEGADSSIRDVDIAEEMMEYSKNSVLIDAGNAMMAQANKFPQDVLTILQNVRAR